MKYLPWSGPPIPANATVTGTYRLSNGIYALYYAGGKVRFLCRVVSAQVKSWLNLSEDGLSGHWDQGSTGEAYYADGRMETFSPWDDSMPFPATMPFSEWLARATADLNQPVPANAPQPAALDLRALRASCSINFQGRPEDSDADTLRIRLLGLLRRLSAAMADFTDSPDRLPGKLSSAPAGVRLSVVVLAPPRTRPDGAGQGPAAGRTILCRVGPLE